MPPEINICFVSEADYPAYRKACVECERMSPDYAVFLKDIQDFEQTIQAQGGRLVKLKINPADLVAWCVSSGRGASGHITSNDRAAYAGSLAVAKQQHSGGEHG